MSFCSNCGRSLDANSKFCPNCGVAVPATEPTPAAPVYEEPAAPTYVAPAAPTYVAPAAPVVTAKAKILGFIGMGLAIGGLVFAIIGLLYTFIGMAAGDGLGLVFAFVFGCFSFPLSIVGGILCNNSMDMGNYSTACSVGTKMRIAGIIVSAAMLFFGFLSLID